MHDVIYSASTLTAAHFNSLTPTVYGKSGTGEKSGEDDYAWFCAYAPADEPKYVIVTVLEQGGGGSDPALHVVRDVLVPSMTSPTHLLPRAILRFDRRLRWIFRRRAPVPLN